MTEEKPQYHLLPKDDPDRVVAILRAAAGLPPLSDEADSSPTSPNPPGWGWPVAERYIIAAREHVDILAPWHAVRFSINDKPQGLLF